MKIVQYDIVSRKYASELERRVKEMIKNGWQPIGGVAFVYQGMGETWAQAMVKYEAEVL